MKNFKNISLFQLKALLPELKEALQGSTFKKAIQKDNHFFIFTFEKRQKEFFLFVRLRQPYIRAHLLSDPKNLPYLLKDRAESLWTKTLIGAKLQRISLYNEDRILEFEFLKEGIKRSLFISLIPYKASLTVKIKEEIVYGSPLPLRKENVEKEEKKEALFSKELEAQYREWEKEEAFLSLQHKLKKELEKKLHKLCKHEAFFKEELQEAKLIEEKRFIANLMKSHFYHINPQSEQVVLEDWREENKKITIYLDPYTSLEKQLKKRFSEIRKMEKRLEIIPMLIQDNQKESDKTHQLLKELQEIKDLFSLQAFEEKHFLKKAKNIKAGSNKAPFRTFVTDANCPIFVGRSDKENEVLSFKFAKGSDLWFHVDGFAGAHVLLKVKKGETPSLDAIQDALQLAKYFSKAKEEKICSVVMTEAKYLYKQKGAALGQVVLKQCKIMQVKGDEKRLKRLFSSKYPLL